jgi:two-component system, NarL family, response regulator LiaR
MMSRPAAFGPRPIRVVVVSPHELVREGLAVQLHAHPERATVVSASRQILVTNADTAVYDLAGLTVGMRPDELLQLARRVPVVGYGRVHLQHLDEAASAFGISRVVPEHVVADELLAALEDTVVRGPPVKDARVLTERELDMLRHIGAGHSNQEIADALGLSANTVKTYVRTAYRKIGVRNRTEALTWCIQFGLVARH